MADRRLLVDHLREPERLASAAAPAWEALIRMARAEALLGQLSVRSREAGVRDALPPRVRTILDEADVAAAWSQRRSRWEARAVARALRPLGVPVVLLKGSAYLHAGLSPAAGRSIGDLDILVPRDALGAVETMLLGAGWTWFKSDPYDDHYYRAWMHELPPLLSERGEMLDLHHTILPPTARPTPDAAALVADALPVGEGLSVLSPTDMIVHAAAHLFADGEFQGGLRNLWDIHRLLAAFEAPGFRAGLRTRARHHQLDRAVDRAIRFADEIFGPRTPPSSGRKPGSSTTVRLDPGFRRDDGEHGTQARFDPLAPLFRRRFLSRDEQGRDRERLVEQLLYIRGHWLRMPPLMLARHLFTKWRKRSP